MRKQFKKLITFGLTAVLTVTSVSTGNITSASTKTATSTSTGGAVTATSTAEVEVPDNPSTFTDLSSSEIIADMGNGWNLGNTMDGHNNYNPSETAWQSTKTTKAIIKKVHDMGYNTIRVPVTWCNMINSDYSVKEEWMSRVQDIIDYATAENMYVILNIHHDGANNGSSTVGYGEDGYDHGWLDITSDDETDWNNVCTKYAGVWKTIATRFKNYNEHLILESMNEVYSVGEGWTSDTSSISKQYAKINKLNQIFVDTVRATGSNNSKRWLLVAALNTNINYALNSYDCGFTLPTDTVSGRLMVSVHDYDNYGRTATSESTSGSYAAQFKALKEKFVDNGIPVVIGEYGFQYSLQADARACKFEGVNYMFKQYGMVGCVWDSNGDGYRLFNRNTLTPYSTMSMTAIARGFFTDTEAPAYIADATSTKLTITPITSISTDTDTVSLAVGSTQTVTATSEPSDNNDVVLWKSDDGTIASVYDGKIVARGIGQTTVYAYALTGEVEKAVTVTVTAQTLSNPTTAIATDFDSYTLTAGDEAFLNAVVTPANGAYLSYASSNSSVATVSTNGKIVAVKDGTATITVTSSDGYTKSITVTVGTVVAGEYATTLGLRLYYYNDSANSYNYTNISTDTVTVSQDGQYTLTFDCDTDFDSAAQTALGGSLKNIAALYITDANVVNGTLTKSQIQSGTIKYDSVVANGTTNLTISDTSSSSVMAGTTFDTGNPLNVWDGSVISEVESTTNSEGASMLNFTSSVGTVKKLTVKFTLSGLSTVAGSSDDSSSSDDTSSSTQEVNDDVESTDEDDSSVTIEVGTTFTVNGVSYAVTDREKLTVAAVEPVKTSITSVNIPATITASSRKFTVTSIDDSAFMNCKKLAKVTIGTNVKTIGSKAFSGDLKLKTIKVNSKKITTVGKNALKGINKKAVIKVPSAKLKAYKTKFKNKGQAKTVKIKK